MVVGRRQTYSAISTDRSVGRPRVTASPRRARMMIVNIAVSPIRTMVTAISLGVLGLFEDSTIRIIWFRYVS